MRPVRCFFLLLALGLLACETQARPPSSPLGPPQAPPAPGTPSPPRPFARLRLGDRFFVEAVLTDVFGPTISEDLAADVHLNPAVFGGACNLYEQVFYEKAAATIALADEASGCFGGMPALNHPLVGSSSTLRAGWLAKVCLRATNNPEAVRFALRASFPSGKLRPPDRNSVRVAYQRFFPGREPPVAVSQALLELTPSALAEDRWQQILMALCLTPDWQIP